MPAPFAVASNASKSLLDLGLLPQAYHGWREAHGFHYWFTRDHSATLSPASGPYNRQQEHGFMSQWVLTAARATDGNLLARRYDTLPDC
jgi:hypothetical protein